MTSLLIVVSRAEPARLRYLTHVFASETLEVISDRREGDRRLVPGSTPSDRRRRERRARDIGAELRALGWALVRR